MSYARQFTDGLGENSWLRRTACRSFFECVARGRLDALWGLGIMAATVLIMLAAVIVATAVAWHGHGRWY
jgi:hypothetical protein